LGAAKVVAAWGRVGLLDLKWSPRQVVFVVAFARPSRTAGDDGQRNLHPT
jgi:hypothetical protein